MKALIQTTIIMLLCAGLASADSSQDSIAPETNLGIQAYEAAAAEPAAPSVPIGASRPVAVSVWPAERGSAGAVLVIPSTEMKPEDIAAVMEDMSIMLRILDKSLGQQRLTATRTGVFFDRNTDPWSEVFVGRSSATQAIYLEGFGSLFLIGVDFPLSAPPKRRRINPKRGSIQCGKKQKRRFITLAIAGDA